MRKVTADRQTDRQTDRWQGQADVPMLLDEAVSRLLPMFIMHLAAPL